MIVFTSDIDWAPDEVVADTIELFEEYGVKCTFFTTHYSDILLRSNKDLFEIGLHPNFNPIIEGLSTKKIDAIIDELLDIHPEAKGVRSHSMLQSTHILQKFADKKFIYDANHFLPYHKNLKPFMLWNGMVRIPYNWEDDVHWAYGHTFEDSKMDLADEGLVIFNFHPIHIFLNTESKYRYDEAKKYYKEPKRLIEYRNTKIKGTRDLLISHLEHCKANKSKTTKLIEIAGEFLLSNNRP